ncbi:hypothetical protein NEMIN01_2024 [Nematocida minor]|uniref:uncharacterized protein n=1 Tax=Nematocida minor TaxID=1912983 RepID=UPI00222070C0|nr:uncharacterized protein NEMIN01_2024 [Nematocida minor]KAI5192460.1 hypothetical protein NEMIN01_2024 [Nematocida minor]
MGEIEEKERELREALMREDKEILAELGKYLEAVVGQIESKEANPDTLEQEIAAEKNMHRKASEIFEKAKQKEHTEEEVNELVEIANNLLKLHQR